MDQKQRSSSFWKKLLVMMARSKGYLKMERKKSSLQMVSKEKCGLMGTQLYILIIRILNRLFQMERYAITSLMLRQLRLRSLMDYKFLSLLIAKLRNTSLMELKKSVFQMVLLNVYSLMEKKKVSSQMEQFKK